MGTWYRTGFVEVVNGSRAVTGTGTQWVENVVPGSILKTADGMFEVDQVVSAVSITLVENYTGPSASGLSYAIIPTQGYIPPLSRKVNELVEQTGAVKDAYANGELLMAGALEAIGGAAKVGTSDGRSVQARLDDLPTEVDAAGTAQVKVSSHNADANAHPAMTAFVTAQADRAETAASMAEDAGLYEYFWDDDAARIAQVGMTSGQRGYDRSTGHVWKYNGAAWVDLGPGPSAGKVSKAEFEQVAGPQPSQVPQVYETLDDLDGASLVVIDAAKNIIGIVRNPAIDPTLVAEKWETLDDRPTLIDRNRNVISYFGSDRVDDVEAALSARIDEQNAASATLDKNLRASSPYLCLSELRTVRMKLAKIKFGAITQAIIAAGGDSFGAPPASYLHVAAKQLQAEYGFAGLGYTGFAWRDTVPPPPVDWGAGNQPTGKELCARYDLSPAGDIVQHYGRWACRRGAFGAPVVLGPMRSRVYSIQVGDYIRFYVPLAPAGYANTAKLFHAPVDTTPGTVAVSWDDGATYGADLAVPNTTGSFALTGVPAGGGWARIKVVSGEVSLCGVNLVNTAPGVIMHKLAIYGALASNYGSGTNAPNRAIWAQQIKALSPDMFSEMLGTNDQAAGTVTPTGYAAEMRRIFDALRAEMPAIDTLWAMPPENNRTTNTYPMTAYSDAARLAALQGRHAFVDLQWDVGDPANFGAAYAYANPNRSWWLDDLTHPNLTEGQYALTAGWLRSLFN